jgi:hypothetical protein
MKLKNLSMMLATTALVALTLPAIAQDKAGSNVDTSASGESGGAATLALAYELYDLGVAQEDALTVLAAAKLAASVDMTMAEAGALDPATVDIEQTARRKAAPAAPAAPAPVMNADGSAAPRPVSMFTSGTAENEDDGDAAAPLDAATMFAKATELAGDDETLKGLIADAEAESSRGRIGGSVTYESRLPHTMYDVWEIPFYGNSYAEVAIVGDGDANLDITITDENGNVICYDVSPSDQVYCDWVPAWDGYFYITVENTGGKRNTYYLLTN